VNQKRRWGLSAAQKTLLWQRWKDGESLSDIGRSLGKHAASIHAIVRPHGGIMPMVRKRGRPEHLFLQSEKKSRAASMQTFQSVRSRHISVGHRRRSAARLHGMAGCTNTERRWLTQKPATRPSARNPAGLPATLSCASWSPGSCN
jgi:hypothetical protein